MVEALAAVDLRIVNSEKRQIALSACAVFFLIRAAYFYFGQSNNIIVNISFSSWIIISIFIVCLSFLLYEKVLPITDVLFITSLLFADFCARLFDVNALHLLSMAIAIVYLMKGKKGSSVRS